MDGRVAKGVSRPASRTIAMPKHRIFTTSFASVYPHYIRKAEAKGRERREVDQVICWLTGYSPEALVEGAATLVRPPAVTERTISGLRVSRPCDNPGLAVRLGF